MWKLTMVLALSALPFAMPNSGRGVRSLESAEASACRGMAPTHENMKCKEIFKAHECNRKNDIDNCSGKEGTDCVTCADSPSSVTKKIWACQPESGWDCTATSDKGEECGTRYKGTCYLDADLEDWFCKPVDATSQKCTKNIPKTCNG